MKRSTIKHIFIILLTVLAFSASLNLGEVNFSFSNLFKSTNDIFWQIRFPQALTAFLVGGGLALAGQLMQTYFLNPLAGPFVLGIHSGASLFVAIFVIGTKTFTVFNSPFLYELGTKGMAFVGSLVVLGMMIFLTRFIQSRAGILIIGLLISYISGAFLNVLINFGNAEEIRSFLLWSMGSFSRVSGGDLWILSLTSLIVIAWSLFLSKRLNLLLLGENYARNLGGNPKSTQKHAILITAIITAIASSYCGPIAFVGIMTPHLLKIIYKTNDHRVLIPLCFISGGFISLVADIISTKIFSTALPLNSVLGLMGGPFLIYFL